MPPALEQHHAIPEPARDHRENRAAESRADDGEIGVVQCCYSVVSGFSRIL
jgi:hypothetical protein